MWLSWESEGDNMNKSTVCHPPAYWLGLDSMFEACESKLITLVWRNHERLQVPAGSFGADGKVSS
jgi:hypothetical protein